MKTKKRIMKLNENHSMYCFYNIFNLPNQTIENMQYIESIKDYFYISPILFIVPLIVILLIVKKINPVISLFIGIMTAALLFLIFQNDLILNFSKETGQNTYQIVINSIVSETNIKTETGFLNELLILIISDFQDS